MYSIISAIVTIMDFPAGIQMQLKVSTQWTGVFEGKIQSSPKNVLLNDNFDLPSQPYFRKSKFIGMKLGQ